MRYDLEVGLERPESLLGLDPSSAYLLGLTGLSVGCRRPEKLTEMAPPSFLVVRLTPAQG